MFALITLSHNERRRQLGEQLSSAIWGGQLYAHKYRCMVFLSGRTSAFRFRLLALVPFSTGFGSCRTERSILESFCSSDVASGAFRVDSRDLESKTTSAYCFGDGDNLKAFACMGAIKRMLQHDFDHTRSQNQAPGCFYISSGAQCPGPTSNGVREMGQICPAAMARAISGGSGGPTKSRFSGTSLPYGSVRKTARWLTGSNTRWCLKVSTARWKASSYPGGMSVP